MNDIILNDIDYQPENDLWVLRNFKGLPYSDGLKQEKHISSTIKKSKDISSGSIELQKAIIDWPSCYHLSNKRSQLIKGFDFSSNIKYILEIGCGCGAITRYLGETFPGACIIAVEGSFMRAAIARSRTRDLSNVRVVVAPFKELKFNIKYDLVVCIGVLEYAPLFMDSDTPFEDMLNLTKKTLKENGVLLLAVENQLGLKYFSGIVEDHTGMLFEGLEGYVNTKGLKGKTIGLNEISDIILKAGFTHIKKFLPFPDYKLPDLIIADSAISPQNRKSFGYMIGKHLWHGYEKKSKKLFDERLVWMELARNGFFYEFSNSFLLLASLKPDIKTIANSWDAIIFTTKRREEYVIKTLFKNMIHEVPLVEKVCISDIMPPSQRLMHKLEKTKWVDGVPLEFDIYKLIKRNKISIDEMTNCLSPWINFLKGKCNDKSYLLDGNYIDAVPWNVIICRDRVELIDREWAWKAPVSIKYIMTRGLYYIMQENAYYGQNIVGYNFRDVRDFLMAICSRFFQDYSNKDIIEFIDIEVEFADSACNISKKAFSKSLHLQLSQQYQLLRFLASIWRWLIIHMIQKK